MAARGLIYSVLCCAAGRRRSGTARPGRARTVNARPRKTWAAGRRRPTSRTSRSSSGAVRSSGQDEITIFEFDYDGAYRPVEGGRAGQRTRGSGAARARLSHVRLRACAPCGHAMARRGLIHRACSAGRGRVLPQGDGVARVSAAADGARARGERRDHAARAHVPAGHVRVRSRSLLPPSPSPPRGPLPPAVAAQGAEAWDGQRLRASSSHPGIRTF